MAAGCVPAPEHRPFATVVPSDCRQETVRDWVSLEEQVLVSLPQVPATHVYEQVLVSLKVPLSAPSVPQV